VAGFTTERGFDRVVNFSDATVAIALTLLVLPLVDLAREAARVGAGTMLSGDYYAIYTFLLSFVVIAVIWLEHHRLFELLVDYNPALLVCNLVWLLAVVALPFSTQTIQAAPAADRVATALYIGNLLLAFLMIAAMHLVARGHPRIVHPDKRAEFHATASLVLAGLCAIALALAVLVPQVGMWALFLLALTGTITRLLRRVRPSR
jgi:uncharacterized membrane protein